MQTNVELRDSTARAELRQPVSGLPDPGERVPKLAWPTVALYVGTLGLFAAGMLGFFAWGWSRWLTVPIGGAVTFLMFSVLHESTHHAISTNTRVNNLFGHLSASFVVAWATFPLVKFIHIEHHRNTNEPRSIDPDAWCEDGPAWLLPLRLATIDIWYIIFYLRRVKDRPQREVASTFTVATVVIAAFAILIVTGYGSDLLWAFLIPNRIGILVLAWWFDYLPHHGLTVTQRENKYQATRVRVGGEAVLTPLFVYQNYHLVHHLHPSIPFYRYVRAWRRNEQAYLDRNAAISTWFGRSLTPSEYRTWRRLTDQVDGSTGGAGQRPVFHPLRVSALDRLTEDSVAVTFDVPSDLAHAYQYAQGQHLTLRAVIDGKEQRRSYSIVESVSARTLKVAVKHLPDGVFSTYVTQSLKAGDILDVMTPTGAFNVTLDPDEARRYVAAVAGSGITPMMSTIATTLEREPDSQFTLIYGNQSAHTTMFAAEIEAMASTFGDRLAVHHVLSRDSEAILSGRVTSDLVLQLVTDPADVHAWFLCGPQEMVDSLKASVSEIADAGRVLTELFHVEDGAAGSGISVEVLSEVTIALDGVESTITVSSMGEPILDAALQAGIDAPYSCAGGACGTCRARVLLGRAVMDQNHVLDETEVADGFILTCQAHPVTEEVRLDYDA